MKGNNLANFTSGKSNVGSCVVDVGNRVEDEVHGEGRIAILTAINYI